MSVRFAVEDFLATSSALVDTGFDGHLAIPAELTGRLPQPSYRHRVRTASGEIVRVPVYLGTVELLDVPGPIDALIIALGDEYLVGIETINHFRVIFDHGREVIVEL